MLKSKVTGKRVTTILTVCCLLALLVGTLGGCPGTPADETREAAAAWLRANAIPFETTEPGSGFADLLPLKELIGDARVVALGEATHGTHEFFQMKHRLVEFLVEEMGFTVFAIEANWPEANRVNDYVHTGVGDPAALLAGLNCGPWNTQEVLDLIHWMRTHNQDPGDAPPVSFAGFDMQSPEMAMDNVLSYFQKVEPAYVKVATDRYYCFRQVRWGHYAPIAGRAACRNGLWEVLDHLVARRATYEALSSRQEYAQAEQSARIVLQAEAVLGGIMAGDLSSFSDRDRYMAQNVVWLLEQAGPEARIILWAHNAHVANGVIAGEKSMGAHLRGFYGEEMVIVGFAFDRGRCSAVACDYKTGRTGEWSSYSVPSAPPGSYEWYLAAAGMPRLILGLRNIPSTSPATAWLTGPHKFRMIGAYYDPSIPEAYFYDANLTTEFDVMIYLAETTPSVLLPFP